MKIKLYIRPTGPDKKKPAIIRVRLVAGREIDLHAKTMITVHPDHWSNETQTYRQRSDIKNLVEKRNQLKMLREVIDNEFTLAEDKYILTSEWLLNVVRSFENPSLNYLKKDSTLTTFIENFVATSNTRLNTKTGKPISYKQVVEYEMTFRYFKEFCKHVKHEYNFHDIDMDFYNKFRSYLEGRNLALNTVGKKIQTLRLFLNQAKCAGYKVNETYKNRRFNAPRENADTIYLTTDEIEKLRGCKLNSTTHQRIRDIFVFACWTGLRFGDFPQVRRENIIKNVLYITQEKTGGHVCIPLHNVALNILDYYNYDLPRSISNQKFNAYIKEIGKEAKINTPITRKITKGGITYEETLPKYELITSLTARRSFASNHYKAKVPSHTIMRYTGHKTEESFLKYLRVSPNEHEDILRRGWSRMSEL